MGGTESSIIKGCVSGKPKKRKADDEDIDETSILKGNSDEYFTKEDIILIKKKYPEYEKWSETTTLEFLDNEPKQKIIKWKASDVIGIGSFGRVLFGLNTENGELMAVKQVEFGKVINPIAQERIRALSAEIEILSLLNHKNIVRYIGSSRNETTFNIFLEYVTGGHTIASLLEKYGKFSENLTRVYTKQIIEGLEYLHVRNTIHRDIKGSNILVDNNGICKLADFGTAKKISYIIDKTFANSLRGTVNWMAPEVIKQKPLGRQSDIWSLGCTVLEMATGKPPWSSSFKGKDQLANMYYIVKAKSPPPIPKDLSPEAQDFLRKCFKIDPKERANIIQLRNHKFVNDNEPMYMEIFEANNSESASSLSNTVSSLTKINKVNPTNSEKRSFNSTSSTELLGNALPNIQQFKSAPGALNRLRERKKDELSRKKDLKLRVNEKIIEEQSSRNSNLMTSQENYNKPDSFRRSVYYESDKDLDLSSEFKNSRNDAKNAKNQQQVALLNKEKLVKQNGEKNNNQSRKSEKLQVLKIRSGSTDLNIKDKSIKNQANLNYNITRSKKHINKAYSKIIEDEVISPSSCVINNDKMYSPDPRINLKYVHHNHHTKEFRLNPISTYEIVEPIDKYESNEEDEEKKYNTVSKKHINNNAFHSTAATNYTTNDNKLITLSEFQTPPIKDLENMMHKPYGIIKEESPPKFSDKSEVCSADMQFPKYCEEDEIVGNGNGNLDDNANGDCDGDENNGNNEIYSEEIKIQDDFNLNHDDHDDRYNFDIDIYHDNLDEKLYHRYVEPECVLSTNEVNCNPHDSVYHDQTNNINTNNNQYQDHKTITPLSNNINEEDDIPHKYESQQQDKKNDYKSYNSQTNEVFMNNLGYLVKSIEEVHDQYRSQIEDKIEKEDTIMFQKKDSRIRAG